MRSTRSWFQNSYLVRSSKALSGRYKIAVPKFMSGIVFGMYLKVEVPKPSVVA